jgi:hypothetical protein
MNTIICAGGSGFKVLESVIHLCAAGLGPPDLRILAIDPDASNGNATRTKGVLKAYRECRRHFGGKVHLASSARGGHGRTPTGEHLFGTAIDLLVPGARDLVVWSPVGEGTLSDLINYPILDASPTRKDVAHLLFTQDELGVPLMKGFLGHTAIGAAATSMVWRRQAEEPWASLVAGIRHDLTHPSGSNVVVVGSVFGGTGASAIHPIVRFLRDVPETNPDRLRIAVTALVPYFQFKFKAQPSGQGDADERMLAMAARAEGFPVATRAAAEFYEYLRSHDDLQADAFFWAGDADQQDVSSAIGGPSQQNPAHFVDLLLALACLGFFREPSRNVGCQYSGPRQAHVLEPSQPDRNFLEWPDLPLHGLDRKEVRDALLRFLVVAIAHGEYFEPLLRRETLDSRRGKDLDVRPYCLPWYYEKFTRFQKNLTSKDHQDELRVLTEYLRDCFRPWLTQIHTVTNVRLFTRLALSTPAEGSSNGMLRLASLLWSQKPDEPDPAAIHDFVRTTVKAAPDASGDDEASTYLAVLAESANRYVRRTYDKV